MLGMKVFAGVATLLSTLSASLALDVDLKTNVAVYWVRHHS